MVNHDISHLIKDIRDITTDVEHEAGCLISNWQPKIERDAFRPSAENLARYLALRHHDLRPFQRRLARFGLSSLGRLESRVAPTLSAVMASLAILSSDSEKIHYLSEDIFYAGERRLAREARAIFGRTNRSPGRAINYMPYRGSGKF